MTTMYSVKNSCDRIAYRIKDERDELIKTEIDIYQIQEGATDNRDLLRVAYFMREFERLAKEYFDSEEQ